MPAPALQWLEDRATAQEATECPYADEWMLAFAGMTGNENTAYPSPLVGEGGAKRRVRGRISASIHPSPATDPSPASGLTALVAIPALRLRCGRSLLKSLRWSDLSALPSQLPHKG